MTTTLLSQVKANNPTLDEKIGQMLLVGFGGVHDRHGAKFNATTQIAKDIKQYHVGGVIYFAKQGNRERNVQNPEQLAQLSHDLQAYNKQVGEKLPLLIGIDQEGGIVDRLGAYGFKLPRYTPQALGANTPELTYTIASKVAKVLHNAGINLNFAPSVDVNINPDNPIIGRLGRSFSDDAQTVSEHAAAFIRGMHSENILTSLKHFPGHGSSSNDSHLEIVDVTQSYTADRELLPFRQLIASHQADMIMTAHVINKSIDPSGLPGTLSKIMLTDLLRNELHYNGVIISDDMSMGAIAKAYALPEAIEKAIDAGVDIFIIPNNDKYQTAEAFAVIKALVESGKISEQRLDASFARIQALKARLS